MPDGEYINHNPYPVQVKGKDGRVVAFQPNEHKVLDGWFKKYAPRYITEIRSTILPKAKKIRMRDSSTYKDRVTAGRNAQVRPIRTRNIVKKPVIRKVQARKVQARDKTTKVVRQRRPRRKIVGSNVRNQRDAARHLSDLLQMVSIPISNDIGVGIISYNRLDSIKRLLESIRKCTDLNKTTVFVSDESSNQQVKEYLKDQKDIVFIDGDERLGIAGNSNRLLRCLERFKYKILLNDDVEILKSGWDYLYANAMKETGIHHFCMRQAGIYGARLDDGSIKKFNSCSVQTITSKPHGAITAFDDIAFRTVGYFDRSFGIYGMEHVDWSNRISLSKIQKPGYHDIVGSENFFKIHNEKTAIESTERTKSYREAKSLFSKLQADEDRIYVNPDDESKVPEVAFIVPFRGKEREGQIALVVKNLRAQKFPRIELIFVEQDWENSVDIDCFGKINYYLARSRDANEPFVKARAFNVGVANSSSEKLILHDADMIVQGDYAQIIFGILDNYESCHICQHVICMDMLSTRSVTKNEELFNGLTATMVISYFEGGSLAVRKKNYYESGGFNNQFVGYGVEDCEFYERLSKLTDFYEDRRLYLIHLWHDRSPGWKNLHQNNKLLGMEIKTMSMDDRIADLHRSLRDNGFGAILDHYGIN